MSLPVPQVNLTPDLTIVAIIGAVTAYGLLLGRNKVKTLALSVYVGIVLGSQLAPGIQHLVTSKVPASGGWLPLILFVLPLLLLELGRREHFGRGSRKGGMGMTLVLCVLVAALTISAGIEFISEAQRADILRTSSLAAGIYGLRLWWIGLVPLAVIGENFIRTKED